MARILLVDDDVDLCTMQSEFLIAEGFEVDFVHDGRSGLQQALSGRHDIVVLDVMMPQVNGIDVLRLIRQECQIPVIMLTARGDDVDRVVGLELGADDYVPKPCNPRELAARIRAILRRVGQDAGAPGKALTVIGAGELTLRPAQRRAEWAGHLLDLTGAEFNLLEMLVRQAGQIISKQDLSMQALGRPLARYDRSIDVHVSNLRQKLGNLSDDRSPIQTVRGAGYIWIMEEEA